MLLVVSVVSLQVAKRKCDRGNCVTNRVTFRVRLSDLLCHRVPLGCFWTIQLCLCRNPQSLVSIHVWEQSCCLWWVRHTPAEFYLLTCHSGPEGKRAEGVWGGDKEGGAGDVLLLARSLPSPGRAGSVCSQHRGWSCCRAFQEMCWCEWVSQGISSPQIFGDLVPS